MKLHLRSLAEVDPEIKAVLDNEEKRQVSVIELIASENMVSKAVLEAAGSVLTNKYAEGYPGKRYYGGCEFVDVAETLAQDRAKQIFGAEHVNVQPHSGSQANTAVYFAALTPGDTILGMNLAHGGHLTHGSPVNISGKYFKRCAVRRRSQYNFIDYDQVRALAKSTSRFDCGREAYPRIMILLSSEPLPIVGALLGGHGSALQACGCRPPPSPVPYADFVTTTTHKTLRGPRGGMILCTQEWAQAIDKAVFPGIRAALSCTSSLPRPWPSKKPSSRPSRNQEQIIRNAKALAEGLVSRGYRLVSGGTDTHLMLVDLTPKNMTGRKAETILDSVGITVNKNAIPLTRENRHYQRHKDWHPAVTRGMKEPEMEVIASLIDAAESRATKRLEAVARQVKELTDRFPFYNA